MKKILLLLIFPAILTGQTDYQCVIPDVNSFFEAGTAYDIFDFKYSPKKYIVGLKVTDSLLTNDYVSYSFYNEFQTENYALQPDPDVDTCLNPYAFSWCGPEVQIYNNGLNVFFNRYYDSIFLYTQADIGDTWTFYQDSSGSHTATVIAIYLKDFLGVTDSVKVIQIDGAFPFTIEISKHYGLIKTINFRDYPGFGENTYQVVQYDLAGMSGLDNGVRLLSTFDIYDYDAGDEIHWQKAEVFGSYGTNLYSYIDKYINKTFINEDTVVYTIDRTFWFQDTDGNIISYTQDTITKIIGYQEMFSGKLPFENYSEDPITLKKYVMYHAANVNGKLVLDTRIMDTEFTLADSNCYSMFLVYTYCARNYYIPGVGHFFSDTQEGSDYMLSWYPKYFSKVDGQWGTPLTPPAGIFSPAVNLSLVFLPNPATKTVRIHLPDIQSHNHYSLEVNDITGRPVALQNIQGVQDEITLDVSSWQEGIYFVIIRSEGKIAGRGKLVVQHD